MGITVTLKEGVSSVHISGSYAFYEPVPYDNARENGIDISRWESLEKKPKEIWKRNEYGYAVFLGFEQ